MGALLLGSAVALALQLGAAGPRRGAAGRPRRVLPDGGGGVTTPTTAVARDEALALAGTRRRVADFLALAKPRVVLMVVLTTLVGYYLGAAGGLDSCGCSTLLSARRWPPAARWRSTSTWSGTWTRGWSGRGCGRCRTGGSRRSRRSSSGG